VRSARDIEQAIEDFARSTPSGGLIVFPTNVTFLNRSLIVAHAGKNRLPAIYADRSYVDDGGLMSYGPDRYVLVSGGGRLCRSHPQRCQPR
jgi:putative ABC transport system substrate-binding protein